MHPRFGTYTELMINERAEALLLHDKPFQEELSWFEYDLDTSRLELIMEDGDIRDFGIAVDRMLAKYLQNAYQILTVMVDRNTGAYQEESYYPLIIHRA